MPDCRGSDIGGVTGNDAVYRSGLQVVQGGCESVAPVSAAPPGETCRHGCPVHRNAKSPSVRMGSSLV
ncbi:hypothetical protein DMS07_28230 [Klebsiella variicola]|nr:hypothetical protein DMS07_28230 [Klebsiella variicola]HBX2041589.1 hypothetical protein [Klebsiella variicola]